MHNSQDMEPAKRSSDRRVMRKMWPYEQQSLTWQDKSIPLTGNEWNWGAIVLSRISQTLKDRCSMFIPHIFNTWDIRTRRDITQGGHEV